MVLWTLMLAAAAQASPALEPRLLDLALTIEHATSTATLSALSPAQLSQVRAELLQRQCLGHLGDRGAARAVEQLAKYFADTGTAQVPATVLLHSEALVKAAHVLPRYAVKNKQGKVTVLVTRAQQRKIAAMAVAEAEKQGIDPAFVLSFIGQESGYYTKAKGGLGEVGLMQLLPSTAITLLKRENPKAKLTKVKVAKMLQDPALNIRLGVTLLKELQDNLEDLARRKKVDMRMVLAAGYNAGQVSVAKTIEKHKRTPKSTEAYVSGILGKVKKLNKQVRQVKKAAAAAAEAS